MSKYASKHPTVTFVRYEHFAYTGQKWHAVSPLYGDRRFATSNEAWDWLFSLNCNLFAPYVYDSAICVNCGGHRHNHGEQFKKEWDK